MNSIALLFDMDGVIVDNHEFHLESWLQFFEKHNIQMTEEEYKAKVNGRTMENIIPKLFGREMTNEEIWEIGEEKEALYRDLYRPHIKPTPGLVTFLSEVVRENTLRTVSTSAPPANVDFTLGQTGLRAYFSTIIDSTMVTHGKPHPEVYLRSAEALGVKPSQCIVFEDAILGIQAGKKAGMKVVGVASTHTREELEAEDTDLVIDDFCGLTLSQLNQLLVDK
ncbi:HAD family hydrolase [Tunicatimonas pelagia]|uniref:HAD family hydrolase n=1 Tax=Tunicatimonas pelagia TaxID=931531 RepID=UPI0026651432|nr:HAD family phosphatase [Tunicatimonas pelagia]WKN42352.1 HAD family phosphatase [Tunicatimonas pelagia]